VVAGDALRACPEEAGAGGALALQRGLVVDLATGTALAHLVLCAIELPSGARHAALSVEDGGRRWALHALLDLYVVHLVVGAVEALQ
jgi:hypothetical protein